MAENVFTLKANYIKTDILNEISNIYASFASGNSDTDLLSKMKENITLPERQLLKEDEQKKFKNRFVSPYEILTLRIKSTIDTGFAEIEADQKSLATLCIERARKTGNKKCAETIKNYNDDFERKTENLRSEFSQAVLGKLDEQILKNNNSSIFMLSMFFTVCKQTNRLTSLITNNTNTLLTYNMLCLYAENGAASYRIVSSGEDCSKCEVFVGNSIPIDDAVAGENFIPFHPNCDCMAEILDKDGNVINCVRYPVDSFKAKNFMFSKIRHTQGDSGLIGIPDEEISRRARDKTLSGKERRRYQKEEKIRGPRNKQKRQNHYNKSITNNIDMLPTIIKNAFVVEKPKDFIKKVIDGTIIIVGITVGIVYFCYSGDTSIFYKFIG